MSRTLLTEGIVVVAVGGAIGFLFGTALGLPGLLITVPLAFLWGCNAAEILDAFGWERSY